MSTGTGTSQRRPNVVVILADDMGWGDLGCYGAQRIPTPGMDRIAAEGVRALDCHSAAALCTPSRYALLTGRYAWRGPLTHGVLPGHGPAIIERTRPTMASVLAGVGYATGVFGKWHLGLDWAFSDGRTVDAFAPGTPLQHEAEVDGWNVDYATPFGGGPLELGFERFFGVAGSLDMPPYCFLDQDRTVGVPDRDKQVYYPPQRRGLQVAAWNETEVDLRFAEEACAWVRSQARSGRPFFAYLATSAPHRPCLPPPFAQGASRAGPRGDMVHVADWVVCQVLDVLDRLDLVDETLLVVTSDNGAELADLDGDTHGHKANGDWRGAKADIWEGGHREPFVARWPGRIPAGSTTGQLMCLSDLMATVASATGAALPEGAGEDSIDMLPALTGRVEGPLRQSLVHHSGDGMFSYRSHAWKAIFGTGSGGFSDPPGRPCAFDFAGGQLYDLAADPRETHNLWRERPDVVRAFYQEMKALARSTASGFSFDVPIPSLPSEVPHRNRTT